MNLFIKLLNQEYISNIFIGITGLFVAIVIFIAEVIKEQNNELHKKVILSKTKIKSQILLVLSMFFYMLITNELEYIDEDNCSLNNFLFILSHSILFLTVMLSIYKTGKLFLEALKLNTEKDYFSKELEKYVYDKVIILEQNATKKNNKKHKKEEKEFKDFIKKQEIYFCDKFNSKKESDYEPIYPEKNGIIGKYDYQKLNEMISFFYNQKFSEEMYISKYKDIVYIPNNIGKKVHKKEPIFYCLKEYVNIFKNITDTVIYKDNRLYIDDEVKLIHNCLFEIASEFKEPDAFDNNNQLLNYFKFLYNEKLYGIRLLAIENLEEMYRKIYNDFSRNRQFCSFLNSLSYLAYSNSEFEDFKTINDFELLLFIRQFDEDTADKKLIAYNFANYVFRFNIYSAKQNSDIKYYDNLLSILFRFIINLIKAKNYDAIDVLLDNISLETINYRDNKLDKYDKINFQFSCGIVYALMLISTHEILNDSYKASIENIINYLKNYLINLYNAWDTIEYFKELFDQENCIQKAYKHLDFEFIEHKYKNSWGGWYIGSTKILKEFLFVFNINFVDLINLNINQVKREDKYFLEELLKLINSDNSALDKYLNIKYDNSMVIQALEIAIKEATEKEKEYNRINQIDVDKVKKFKELIKQNMQKDSSFINKLKKYNKLQKSNKKLKKVYGFNQLIPRELFFSEIVGYESVAQNYCRTLDIGIEKEYIRKIDSNSKKIEDSFEDTLKNLENIQDYIIVTNYLNKTYIDKFEYNYLEKTITYDDKKIPVINVPQANDLYLLKQQDLPTLYLCEFDDEWNCEDIDNSVFCELVDCSVNEVVRNEIIEKSDWIKEKGDYDNQINFLKEHYRLRLFIAYTINIEKDVNVFKFDNNS